MPLSSPATTLNIVNLRLAEWCSITRTIHCFPFWRGAHWKQGGGERKVTWAAAFLLFSAVAVPLIGPARGQGCGNSQQMNTSHWRAEIWAYAAGDTEGNLREEKKDIQPCLLSASCSVVNHNLILKTGQAQESLCSHSLTSRRATCRSCTKCCLSLAFSEHCQLLSQHRREITEQGTTNKEMIRLCALNPECWY